MEERVAALARECCNDVHGAAYDLSTLCCLLPTAPPARSSLRESAYNPPPPLKAYQTYVALAGPRCSSAPRCATQHRMLTRFGAAYNSDCKGWHRHPEQWHGKFAAAYARTGGSVDATPAVVSVTGTEWPGGAEQIAGLREQQGRMAESRVGEYGRRAVLLCNVSFGAK